MIKKILSFFIIFYQKVVSPSLPRSCRFYPSCSEYALGSIAEHGAGVGLLKATWRILRCHPFSSGGYDPVIKKANEEKISLNSSPLKKKARI